MEEIQEKKRTPHDQYLRLTEIADKIIVNCKSTVNSNQYSFSLLNIFVAEENKNKFRCEEHEKTLIWADYRKHMKNIHLCDLFLTLKEDPEKKVIKNFRQAKSLLKSAFLISYFKKMNGEPRAHQETAESTEVNENSLDRYTLTENDITLLKQAYEYSQFNVNDYFVTGPNDNG